MSQIITPAELVGMNEQELRALYGRLISDLRRNGHSAFLCPHINASLENVQQALHRIQQRPRPPQGPRF